MDAALVIIAAHEDEVAPLVIAALRSTSRRLYLYFAGKHPSAMLGIAPSLHLANKLSSFVRPASVSSVRASQSPCAEQYCPQTCFKR